MSEGAVDFARSNGKVKEELYVGSCPKLTSTRIKISCQKLLTPYDYGVSCLPVYVSLEDTCCPESGCTASLEERPIACQKLGSFSAIEYSM